MAEETAVLNSGDTAWMLTATALVLFMTIPGLSLFYAGMVRSKNVLSVLMQCFAITSLMTVLWVLYAYSIAFGGVGLYWSGLDKMFLKGIGVDTLSGSIPETVFMTFQMTFAIITPALIVGAIAERMKFSAMLVFMTPWMTVVYAPVCHWVWGTGEWLGNKGILDFAGGTVVHINAGMAGIFCAESLGGAGFGDGINSIVSQVKVQSLGVGATLLYTGIMSAIILKVIHGIMGLRVSDDEEMEGLDLALHNERGYIISR